MGEKIIESGTGAITWGEVAAKQWRSIESAPKGPKAILGFMWIGDGPVTRVLHWDDDDAEWHSGGHQYQPTHWMPLPDPPA